MEHVFGGNPAACFYCYWRYCVCDWWVRQSLVMFKLSLHESNVSQPELSGTMLHPTTLTCSAQWDTPTLADLSLGWAPLLLWFSRTITHAIFNCSSETPRRVRWDETLLSQESSSQHSYPLLGKSIYRRSILINTHIPLHSCDTKLITCPPSPFVYLVALS